MWCQKLSSGWLSYSRAGWVWRTFEQAVFCCLARDSLDVVVGVVSRPHSRRCPRLCNLLRVALVLRSLEGHVPVMFRSCSGHIPVMFQSCSGHVPAMFSGFGFCLCFRFKCRVLRALEAFCYYGVLLQVDVSVFKGQAWLYFMSIKARRVRTLRLDM